ncbi:hypothetical protein EAH86_15875 [Pedococcus bigeumensis]|uniref:Uncharacterized protein n=1 Tax=Pedococcus bigeumensis TaxID=433644 RepID=A0A502CQ39_9MICO|nr:hypothetical protein EAH86_15875 [Pedococcus bigeumensis]
MGAPLATATAVVPPLVFLAVVAVLSTVLTTPAAGIPTATALFAVVVTTLVMVTRSGGGCARHTQSDGGGSR